MALRPVLRLKNHASTRILSATTSSFHTSTSKCDIESWKIPQRLQGSVVTVVELHSEAGEIQYVFAPQ